LQLRTVVNGLSGYSALTLAGYALAVTMVVVGARFVWFFTVPYAVRALDRRPPARRERREGAWWRLVVAWSGMRGAVSLAVALALPLTTNTGSAFPQRNLIIFLTFALIFFTLVVQGLSLPALVARPGAGGGDADEMEEETRARLAAADAAIAEIDALGEEEWTRDETVRRMRDFYAYRQRRFAARADDMDDEGYEDRSLAYQQMVRLVLEAQRQALLRMRSDGLLSNETLHRLIRELDLEESRLEI
jgi:NhaP-type Na+/H+ or K+/H+ antiporter